MDSSKIVSLVQAHERELSSRYARLTSNSTRLLERDLEALHALLSAESQAQLASVDDECEQLETRVKEGWTRIVSWRACLGDGPSADHQTGRTDMALQDQLTVVQRLIASMRDRMRDRGKQVQLLISRLRSYRDALGHDFVNVAGLDDDDANTAENVQQQRENGGGGKDPLESEEGWEHLDLRLERLTELESAVIRSEAEIMSRRATLNDDAAEVFALRTELGISQNGGTGSDPLDDAILAHLGINTESRERVELPASLENLQRVKAKRESLEREKRAREQEIQDTYDRLFPLWALLGVAEQESDAFVERWMGSTRDVVDAYKAELARMQALKRQNLALFIAHQREILNDTWDRMYLPQSAPQRAALFPPINIDVAPHVFTNPETGKQEERVNDNVSEELLVAHEREVAKWQAELARLGDVLERVARYFALIDEARALEESAKDPNRLMGRGNRGDPGLLLREEKARKRIAREKPKLESELRAFVPQWEQEQGREFTVNGRRFLDQLEEMLEAEALEKEAKRRPRAPVAGSSSSSSARPMRAQATGSSTAPLRSQATGSSTGPMRAQMTGASSSQAGVKRHLTGSSTTSSRSGAPPPKKPALTKSVSAAAPPPQPHQQQSQAAPRAALGELSNQQPIAPQRTGLGLPAGWGAPSSHADAAGAATMLKPQRTGGFRPHGTSH